MNHSSDASGIFRVGSSAPLPPQSSASVGVPVQMSSSTVPSYSTSRIQSGMVRPTR